MRASWLAMVASLAILLAACTSATDPAAVPSSPPSASTGSSRVEVRLTDTFKIEPAEITVDAGVPITFVVTNVGATEHEFFLGDESAQAAHEQEMQEMGGMSHDEAMGIAVQPGATKELTVTFAEEGSILAGCHVAGHYEAGMRAMVDISS